jgi:hypothetical protein
VEPGKYLHRLVSRATLIASRIALIANKCFVDGVAEMDVFFGVEVIQGSFQGLIFQGRFFEISNCTSDHI